MCLRTIYELVTSAHRIWYPGFAAVYAADQRKGGR